MELVEKNMKNNKKKYLHNQRNGAFERELVERINLFEEPVRTELLTDFREVSQEETYFYFDKKYKKTMIFDLFAMFYATVFIRHLKKLCKIKKKPPLMAQKDGTGRKKQEMCDGRIHL